MRKLPVLSSKDVLKVLQQNGFIEQAGMAKEEFLKFL